MGGKRFVRTQTVRSGRMRKTGGRRKRWTAQVVAVAFGELSLALALLSFGPVSVTPRAAIIPGGEGS
ncbi:MAG: hypothetical protein CBB71_10815 [Rhodopirellula sp. TMED11]|nr:MAG: hypothetical protein CBB71_10815 [Rhodopirellula sp. TMED11]